MPASTVYLRPHKADLLGLLAAVLVVVAVLTDQPDVLFVAAAVAVLMVGARH